MTQHFRRSPNSVGGAHASSMLSALIAVGDEVVLKPQTPGKCSPQNMGMVGTVTDNIVSKGSLKPTYRVKCATACLSVHSNVITACLSKSKFAHSGGVRGKRQQKHLTTSK